MNLTVRDEGVYILLNCDETRVCVIPTSNVNAALYDTEYGHDGEDSYLYLSSTRVYNTFKNAAAFTSYECAMDLVGRMLAGSIHDGGVHYIRDYVDVPFKEMNRPEEW